MNLDYFCISHNQLCCAACLSKIKVKGNGKHNKCDVCTIKKIKNKKKNKLEENIKYLKELLNNLEELINKLKNIFEKINIKKEELKLSIKQIFTKIRNTLNKREDEILLEVDKKFEEISFTEKLIRESGGLPKKIKMSLEKCKVINNEWKDKNKLSSLINDCINIENNIREIKEINENIKKCISIDNIEIKFKPDEKEVNNYLDELGQFGELYKDKIIENNKDKNELENLEKEENK